MLQTYEDHLDADTEWALSEGSRHFDEKSAVHETLRDLADVQELVRHLNLGIDTANRLDPSVRDEFRALWKAVQEDRTEP